ncbi:MAG TPA: hypothetical protein VNN20_02490 [Thermodesulfobacteriota bacterium]|nr:hypothetical protein [Thermodesulfobacteriota bacterium]
MGDVILELLEFIKKEHQQIRENYIEVTKEAIAEMKQLRQTLESVNKALANLDKTHNLSELSRERFVTLKELTELYPIPLKRLLDIISRDKFPVIEENGEIRVRLDKFDQWFKGSEVGDESNIVRLHESE